MDIELVFRLTFIGIFGCSILISGFYRRRARASGETISRRAEGGGVIAMRLLFALPLFGSIFSYMINPGWMSWSVVLVPVWVRWIGVVSGVLCVPLLWWVFSSIGNNISETVLTKSEHELVTHGAYRWVRHPLYAVAPMMFASGGVIASSWWIVSFAVVAMAMIVGVVVPREERALVGKFGEAYEEYRRRVGMVFPRIGSFAG